MISLTIFTSDQVPSEDILLSYSSSPKTLKVPIPGDIKPEDGFAVSLEINDPEEDGGGHVLEHSAGEEERGRIHFTSLVSAGAVSSWTVGLTGKTAHNVKMCFDPKPKDLANVRNIKVIVSSDMVNDKNVRIRIVKSNCDDVKSSDVQSICDGDCSSTTLAIILCCILAALIVAGPVMSVWLTTRTTYCCCALHGICKNF